MNRDCANFTEFYSNNGIYEAFYTELKKPRKSRLSGLRARLVGLFRAVVAFLCTVRVRRIARVGCTTVALIGTIGTAGALETGKLSPIACLLLAAGFLSVAYFTLKPSSRTLRASKEKESKDTESILGATSDEFRKRFADSSCRLDRL